MSTSTFRLPVALKRFEPVVNTIIKNFEGYEFDNYTCADEILYLINCLKNEEDVLNTETRFKHLLVNMECWYARCFARDQASSTKLAVWNPLEQSFLAFKQHYSHANLQIYSAENTNPPKDVLLKWLNTNIPHVS